MLLQQCIPQRVQQKIWKHLQEGDANFFSLHHKQSSSVPTLVVLHVLTRLETQQVPASTSIVLELLLELYKEMMQDDDHESNLLVLLALLVPRIQNDDAMAQLVQHEKFENLVQASLPLLLRQTPSEQVLALQFWKRIMMHTKKHVEFVQHWCTLVQHLQQDSAIQMLANPIFNLASVSLYHLMQKDDMRDALVKQVLQDTKWQEYTICKLLVFNFLFRILRSKSNYNSTALGMTILEMCQSWNANSETALVQFDCFCFVTASQVQTQYFNAKRLMTLAEHKWKSLKEHIGETNADNGCVSLLYLAPLVPKFCAHRVTNNLLEIIRTEQNVDRINGLYYIFMVIPYQQVLKDAVHWLQTLSQLPDEELIRSAIARIRQGIDEQKWNDLVQQLNQNACNKVQALVQQ